jgi:hypothetical protein
MPYPVYGAYVLATSQTPPADEALRRVPISHEDAWQNGGYAVQWWLFAAMALVAFGWQARKEATGKQPPSGPRPKAAPRGPATGDRVEEADRRRAAGGDRVEEADRRRAAGGDRVEESDRRRAAGERAAAGDRVAEADRKIAAQSPQD